MSRHDCSHIRIFYHSKKASSEPIVTIRLTFRDKQDARETLRKLLAPRGWISHLRDGSQDSIALNLSAEEIKELVLDFQHSYQELIFLH